MTRYFTLLLLLISTSLFVARADDATKAKKIEEFFKIAKIDQLSEQAMNQAMDQVNTGVMQQLFGVNLTPQQQEQLNQFQAKIKAVLTDALGWQKLEPEYEKLYADAYTEQQLDDLIAFYKTPTGQVVVEKTPLLMKQAGQVSQDHLKTAVPQIRQLMQDFIAQQTPKSNSPTPKN